MTRRLVGLAIVVVLAIVSTGVLLASRDRVPTTVRPAPPQTSGLTLLVVNTDRGPLAAVVGGTGFGEPGTLVLPLSAVVTVPGQGEATVVEALDLPSRQAATAVANLIGVWIDQTAEIGHLRMSALVDRAGGVEVGDQTLSGPEVDALLSQPGAGRARSLEVVLQGLMTSGVDWTTEDLLDASDPEAAVGLLNAAAGGAVAMLPAEEVASGVFQSSPEAVSAALVEAFGGPAEAAVPVIVLNGNGVPGIGELVAEKILPGGFRVAVSENASTFDHDETLVVVGSSNDVDLAERVRDLLGVGSVSVSVGSGIAPVTVVVGKDFIG
jgi:LytR cell envelope-related transcriptional attenuator